MRVSERAVRFFGQAVALTALILCALAPGASANPSGPAYLDELGSQLRPLRAGDDAAIGDARRTDVTVSEAERVLVDIYVSGSAEAAADRLRDAGMSVAATADDPLGMVEGWVPVMSLGETAKLGVTDAVLPVIAGGSDAGSVLSQGVAAHRIPQANAAGAGTGTGIDVGVVSTSIDQVLGGVATSQASGNLPANVTVLKDFTGAGADDEGRAMAEIIYDEAPALNRFYFASGVGSGPAATGPVDKADSINQLVAADVDVIADDIFKLNEPFFQDGVVAAAVDNARAAGIPYFASAGNRGRQSYEATYSDSGGFHDFDPGAGVDTTQTLATVPNGSFIQVVLDWDEPVGAAQTDLNALLTTSAGAALPGSAPTGGTDANLTTLVGKEIVTWSNASGGSVSVGLRIPRTAPAVSPRSPFMKYIARGNFGAFTIGEFPTNSDTINPDAASAKGAITVAAVSAADSGLNTPESFSSRGPKTRLFDAAGVRLPSPEVRAKPDLAAADAVSTSVPGSFLTFSGTSASTPSAAGIAAILLSTNPNASVNEIRAQMTDPLNAIDCTSSALVPDPDCGAGFVLADSAAAALDRTGPVVQVALNPAAPNGKGGWYTKTVAINWSVTDPESPVESALCPTVNDSSDGVETFNCNGATSGGGTGAGTVQVKRDTVKPAVPKIKGFHGGHPPPLSKVKCKSSDATSGLANCKLTGYSRRPGKHTLVATALDRAGLKSVRKQKYRVARREAAGPPGRARPLPLGVMLGGGSITLFHVRGIRIAVDWSWFIVLFLVIVWLSGFYGDVLGEPSSSTNAYILAVASAIGFFGSILLHELGHAYFARREGIGISSIQLWIFGGVARMEKETETPAAEFKVAIGGPLVTFAIVVLLTLGGVIAAGTSDFKDAMLVRGTAGTSGVLAMVAWLASINLLVLVFNLLPAFPMDGGRIARAIAWWRSGDRASATRFAATLGQAFAYLFIGAGIFLVFTGDLFSGVWLALIGMVINGSARAANMQTAITSRIEGILVSDVMDREPVAIPEELSVEQALDQYFLRYRWPWFPVVDAGRRFRGLLERDRADEVPEVSRASSTVADLLEFDRGALHVSEDAPLDSLLGNQNLRRFGALMAIDASGRLSGIVTADQVGRALRDATETRSIP